MPSSDLTQYFIKMKDIANTELGEVDYLVCTSQDMNPESPASLVIDGGAAVDGVAIFNSVTRIKFTAGDDVDLSEITYKVTGTDIGGNVIVEYVLGPISGEPVYTVNYFLTVTEIEVIDGDGNEALGQVGVDISGAVKVFDGPARIRSIYYSQDGGNSDAIEFRKGSLTGEIGFAFCPANGANILFPDMGIRFPSSCYLWYPDPGAFRSLSVMVS